MKMIKSTVILLTLFLSVNGIGQEENRILDYAFEFEKGSTELLYGNQVVFRSKPTASSDALDTLSICEKIKIIEKSNEITMINGQESNWYKVKAKGKTGFILGGLIALDHKEINGKTYLVSKAFHDERLYARVRVVDKNKEFYGHETELVTHAFSIAVYSDRGIDGIEDMIKINLFAEACGVDGGEFYLFNDGKQLVEALHLTSVADGGVFWFHESVRFPDEENGNENELVYIREFGESMNEELNWMKSTTHTLTIKWIDGKFSPDIKTFDFEEEPEY